MCYDLTRQAKLLLKDMNYKDLALNIEWNDFGMHAIPNIQWLCAKQRKRKPISIEPTQTRDGRKNNKENFGGNENTNRQNFRTPFFMNREKQA